MCVQSLAGRVGCLSVWVVRMAADETNENKKADEAARKRRIAAAETKGNGEKEKKREGRGCSCGRFIPIRHTKQTIHSIRVRRRLLRGDTSPPQPATRGQPLSRRRPSPLQGADELAAVPSRICFSVRQHRRSPTRQYKDRQQMLVAAVAAAPVGDPAGALLWCSGTRLWLPVRAVTRSPRGALAASASAQEGW